MKTKNCERCWKIINDIGWRKYCSKCRVVVDKELNKRYRDNNIEEIRIKNRERARYKRSLLVRDR
jgi:hypothetical protein